MTPNVHLNLCQLLTSKHQSLYKNGWQATINFLTKAFELLLLLNIKGSMEKIFCFLLMEI